MQEEIQKAMVVLNIDKLEGVFRFAIGITDNTDPYIASVITYFSFYLDTDSYILSTLIDKFMDEVAAGNIQFGTDDSNTDDSATVGTSEVTSDSTSDGDSKLPPTELIK